MDDMFSCASLYTTIPLLFGHGHIIKNTPRDLLRIHSLLLLAFNSLLLYSISGQNLYRVSRSYQFERYSDMSRYLGGQVKSCVYCCSKCSAIFRTFPSGDYTLPVHLPEAQKSTASKIWFGYNWNDFISRISTLLCTQYPFSWTK